MGTSCPKCGCRKFRSVLSFRVRVNAGRKFVPKAIYVECVKCDELWDRLAKPTTT